MRLDGCIKVEQKQIRVVKLLPERFLTLSLYMTFCMKKPNQNHQKCLMHTTFLLTDKNFRSFSAHWVTAFVKKREAAERCKAGQLSKKGYRPDREAVDTIIEKMKKRV